MEKACWIFIMFLTTINLSDSFDLLLTSREADNLEIHCSLVIIHINPHSQSLTNTHKHTQTHTNTHTHTHTHVCTYVCAQRDTQYDMISEICTFTNNLSKSPCAMCEIDCFFSNPYLVIDFSELNIPVGAVFLFGHRGRDLLLYKQAFCT